MFTDTQIRAVFHFYFFASPRYSEDMDIDVVAVSLQTLRKNGYKILNDGAFQRSLRSFDIADIEVNDLAKAKQTETTQQFRFGLITPAGHRLPTKVEFSRRNSRRKERCDGEAESALVDTQVARCYRRLSFRCPHYTGGAAVVQKVRALAGRPVTQARDVFDLAILFRGGHSPPAAWSQLFANGEHAKAMECLIGLTWQEYEGQVVEFLELDSRKEYGSKDAWSSLQNLVLSQLEADA